jgi:hypothetical protein
MAEKKATSQDAQLILELFNLRREAELRKARNWVEMEFWPRTFEDVKKVMADYNSQGNLYLRMVTGYWEMAASLVVQGALSPKLFHANNGEMYFLYTKLHPFIAQMRQEFESPEFLSNIEGVINITPGGKERLERFIVGLKRWIEEREKAGPKTVTAA